MPTINVGVTEAESLTLTDGYSVETNSSASGGAVVWIDAGQSLTSGTATGDFSGPSGTYQVKINYLDENDGVATWTVFVNGLSVGSFNGDGGGSPLGTPASETFTVALNDGDTIAVTADQGGGERGRFDSIELSQLGAFNVGSNEAENLNLNNYTVESIGSASGGQVVTLPIAPGDPTGTVSGTFTGPSGAYDIRTTFFNESDGVGTYEVLVNGVSVGGWSGTGGGAGLGTPDTRTVSANLETGDTVTIRGTRGDGERGRIDVIDIEAGKTIGVGLTEAEDLTLDNYEELSVAGASGGAVASLPAPAGGTGTVSGIFDGLDGTYSLTVNYLDESDGVSTFRVLINGVEQTSFTGDAGGNTTGTPDSETITVQLNAGDTIAVEGTSGGAEFARVDSLQLTVINTAPAAGNDTANTTEDSSVNVAVLANDSDSEGDPFTITEIDGNSVIQGETVGITNGSVTFETNNTFTVTPDADFSGTLQFSYTVSDGSAASSASVTVNVDPVNDAPAAVGDTASTLEDNSVSVDVLANDTDVEGDTLSVTAIAGTAVTAGQSVSVTNATVTLQANGSLTVAPDTNFAGEVVFDYTVSDGTNTDTATVAVTVGSVNDGLVAVADTAITAEDTNVNLDVTANDIDPDGDTLTITEIAGTPVSAGDTVDVGSANVTLETNGTLTVVPDANFFGEVGFAYTVSDGDINDDGSVTVVVTPINDAPAATDDTGTAVEDGSTNINVLANDSDGDGDTLAITAIAGQAITVGGNVDIGDATVTLETNRTLTVTPDANVDGNVTFGYTVSDGFTSDTATVTVAVSGVNDSPVAADDAAGTQEDAAVTVNVLGNDADPDGDALTVTAIAGTAVAPGGSVDVGDATVALNTNGTLLVTPDTGFDGTIDFSYTASDGSLSSTADVSVVVEGVIADPTNGNDVINGTSGNNVIDGLDGDDEVFGGAGDDTLSGGNGNDVVAGGGGEDLITGGSGNDDLRGGTGDDTVIGGDGNDRLRVGGGDDFGFGGNGDDFLQGAAGDDTLFGEDGDDVLYGGTGIDTLDGGGGNDELRAGSSGDRLTGGDGDDTLLAQSGNDIADGGDGNDLVNGAAGNDTLLGGAGDDTINGGVGNDTIFGGIGNDTIRGQAGNDTFVFDAADAGSDTVIGYETGETIQLNGFGYASASDAAMDFSQVGNDVVFQNGDVSITFTETTLFGLFEGIAVGSSGAAASASAGMERADPMDIEAMFAADLDDDASLF